VTSALNPSLVLLFRLGTNFPIVWRRKKNCEQFGRYFYLGRPGPSIYFRPNFLSAMQIHETRETNGGSCTRKICLGKVSPVTGRSIREHATPPFIRNGAIGIWIGCRGVGLGKQRRRGLVRSVVGRVSDVMWQQGHHVAGCPSGGSSLCRDWLAGRVIFRDGNLGINI
jgi:hypothetical protein